MALVLAGALLTSNTGYAQAAQEQAADTIIKSVVSETVFALQAAGKQQSKAVVQAKSKKKNAKKNRKAHLAYERQIQKTKKEIEEPYISYFAYEDINGDGIDECIILGDCMEDGKNKKKINLNSNMMAIYTYYNGKVNRILDALCGGYVYKGCINIKQKCIYRHSVISYNEYSFQKIKIKNGKAKKVATYESKALYNKNGEQICKYIVNGKNVSKKKFEKIKASVLNTSKITMYKVTKKNMEKLRQ